MILEVTHDLPVIEETILFRVVCHAIRSIDRILFSNLSPAFLLCFGLFLRGKDFIILVACAEEASSEEMGVPLSFASSKGVELVVDWLGSVWLAALAAHPLKTADAQSAIVSKRVVIFCFFIF
ncbi:hypothetical protein DWV55_07645 [Butyricicoccus sp. AF10-3]|nr:hypothetical protein DWV55_07645 [Butyricicoccus sp. AF10-3]